MRRISSDNERSCLYIQQAIPIVTLWLPIIAIILATVEIIQSMNGNSMTAIITAFQQNSLSTTNLNRRQQQWGRTRFLLHQHLSWKRSPRRNHQRDEDETARSNDDDISTAMTTLRHMMYPIQIQQLEEIFIRSPSYYTTTTTSSSSFTSKIAISQQPNRVKAAVIATPQQFIELCLHCLLHNDIPYPDSGIRYLLRVSTNQWQQQIYKSIGYKSSIIQQSRLNRSSNSGLNKELSSPIFEANDNEIDSIVSTISSTISQQNNQFGILVGEGERYKVLFPSDPIEYDIDIQNDLYDGCSASNVGSTTTTSIWMECQLRDVNTNQLLVMMGWQLLCYRESYHVPLTKNSCTDSCYYQIDRVDWQDFRESFRPGIGREEWMRICG